VLPNWKLIPPPTRSPPKQTRQKRKSTAISKTRSTTAKRSSDVNKFPPKLPYKRTDEENDTIVAAHVKQ
jgi:hypothetical protein